MRFGSYYLQNYTYYIKQVLLFLKLKDRVKRESKKCKIKKICDDKSLGSSVPLLPKQIRNMDTMTHMYFIE